MPLVRLRGADLVGPTHIGTIENWVDMDMSEVLPCPLQEGVYLGPRGGEEQGVDSQPSGECQCAGDCVAMCPNLSHSRIAADHRHNPLVEVFKWCSISPGHSGDDVLGAVPSGLLSDGG